MTKPDEKLEKPGNDLLDEEAADTEEAGETKEAKFAITLDKTQPIMLNDATDGRAWMEHGVNKEQIMARNKKTPDGSVKIWDYFENIINKNVEKGRIKEQPLGVSL